VGINKKESDVKKNLRLSLEKVKSRHRQFTLTPSRNPIK